ncbi:NADPH-dependent oxidoreductase [Psychromonas sp. psych-6C06]|uniref:NADPH-dependent FMN reductase n=1 Tax=Psychromonas sp. psych-6C06 TaxID=2058089 RepID=UPI000C33E017|nr:NAD(P)H-dependent oxidoreductase [Psychromonas sp. psych-6C06]PKF63293.1 NADPH-dependent oxidoreductase [Psychromonas sp. psych-6C06]
MKLLIISGSHRKDSQTAKVANYINSQKSSFTKSDHIDLCELDLPFWDASSDYKSSNEAWLGLSEKMHQADAFILMTPEWAGTASPLIKNLLLMSELADTAHKPVMLVGTSSGINGAYPVAELRMNGLKNTKLIAVPDYLIVRNVDQVLNENSAVTEHDISMRKRIDYSLMMLNEYAQAMRPIREGFFKQEKSLQQRYAFGM